MIFVSHDVNEVQEIRDRATILRNGTLIDTVVARDTAHDAFAGRIVGLFGADIHGHAARLGARPGVKPNVPALPLAALSGGNAPKAPPAARPRVRDPGSVTGSLVPGRS